MGIFDKAKDALSKHGDKVDQGLDKLGGIANRKTGGQHGDKIDKGLRAAKDKLAQQRRDTPPS